MKGDIITIALPKGRLFEPAVALFEKIGIKGSGLMKDSRRLIFDTNKKDVRFLIIRDTDVPTYVEYGAADMGIVGKDVLLEQERDVYEPLDLKFGYCQIVVAGPEGLKGHNNIADWNGLKVATKYPNLTERFFSQRGIHVEVIKLYGSIELAPLVGLADRIADLISSGQTLRDNGLSVVEVVAESTARLIVNRASLKTRYDRVRELIDRLQKEIEGE